MSSLTGGALLVATLASFYTFGTARGFGRGAIHHGARSGLVARLDSYCT